jgi:hypothetical protein
MNSICISRSFHRYFWLLSGHYHIQVVVDTEAVVLAVSQAVDMEVEVLEAVDLVGAMVGMVAVVLEVSEVVAMGVVMAASEAVDTEVV